MKGEERKCSLNLSIKFEITSMFDEVFNKILIQDNISY